jgi:hypothetical protein
MVDRRHQRTILVAYLFVSSAGLLLVSVDVGVERRQTVTTSTVAILVLYFWM